jgi:hypothetical protein
MPFAGVLLAESLRTGAVIEGVPFLVRRVRRFEAGDPAAGQPRTWTFIEFVVADASAGLFADRAAAALAPGPWYCDLHSDDEVVVVFADRVFRYARGDSRARRDVEAHARSVGVPEAQVDWSE